MSQKSSKKPIQETVDSHSKNYLTESEMKKFLAAARKGRHGVRDYCLMLVAYRHGMRVSELIDIRLKDVDLETARIFVRRVKGSLSTHPPIEGDELRAIRAWFCARIIHNADRVSRTGWGVFYHEKSLFDEAPLPFPRKPPPQKTELAPIEIRDFAYRKLIELAPATNSKEIIDGQKGLRSRKILNFENYGSLPPTRSERHDLAKIIRASINREFPDYVRKFKFNLSGIPGFWIDESGKAQLWLEKDYSYPLMLIPYRSPSGLIQACQIRYMSQTSQNELRYVWLSTPKKSNGVSCGCPIHYARHHAIFPSINKPILATEGALKAETVQAFKPELNVVAIGGISSSHSELIKAARFSP